jgi:anaerobic magnesium-protoporphyrin IX monomethyl ester cyclase
MSAEKNVLLVNPPASTPLGMVCAATILIPPMGLAYLASMVRRAGYRPSILDMRAPGNGKARFIEEFERLRPRVVGFSVMTDFVTNALRLARIVKRLDPECWVVFGGPHPGYRAEEILHTGVVDVVAIKGDGEEVFREICDAAYDGDRGDRAQLARIGGVVYREGMEIVRTPARGLLMNLDQIPWPAWDVLRLEDYNVPLVHSTRGCVGHCKFCCEGVGAVNRLRFRSIDHVMEEIDYLYGRGVRMLSFSDDNFVSGRKRLDELCRALAGRFPGLHWTCETRVDTTSLDDLRLMYEAGCRSVHFGVESISKKTLDELGKRYHLDQVVERVALAAELGITNFLTFVIGLPNETEEQIRDSFATALELKKKYRAICAFSILTPYPGSEYGDHPERYGITINSRNYDHYNTITSVISTRHLSQRQLQNLHCELTMASMSASDSNGDALRLVERGFINELGRVTIVQDNFKFAPDYPAKLALEPLAEEMSTSAV